MKNCPTVPQQSYGPDRSKRYVNIYTCEVELYVILVILPDTEIDKNIYIYGRLNYPPPHPQLK